MNYLFHFPKFKSVKHIRRHARVHPRTYFYKATCKILKDLEELKSTLFLGSTFKELEYTV